MLRLLSLLVLVLTIPLSAQEKLRVVVTLPYIAEIVEAVGGDLVSVQVLVEPGQDPHDIQVSPDMTGQLKSARLFIENGMTLEGFTPRLLSAAGQAFLMPGKGGHAYATDGIVALEKPDPKTIAAGGHVHAAGNPHVWLDPINLKVVARNVEKALQSSLYNDREILAARRAAFEKSVDDAMFGADLVKLLGGRRLENLHRTDELRDFLESKDYRGEKLIQRAGGWWGRAYKLKSKRFVSFHKTWSYLERAFGLEIVGTLEEKPGIPPSPAHLAKLSTLAREKAVLAVISPPYYPTSRIESFAAEIAVKALVLPTQPGESGANRSLFAVYDFIFDQLEALQK